MNAAEVVIRKMQSDSGFMVSQLLPECIRKPSQAANLHSHRQIGLWI
jgi:hypothetical protein